MSKDGFSSSHDIGNNTIRLHPGDNVVVLPRQVNPGEPTVIDGREVLIPAQLDLGHKLASRDIMAGEKILKYGVSIGSATVFIGFGEHVHVHNVHSDFMAQRESR